MPNQVYFPKLDSGDPITLKSVEDKLVVNVTDEKSPVNNKPCALYTIDEINLLNALLRGEEVDVNEDSHNNSPSNEEKPSKG